MAFELTVFELRDEINENLKVHLEYTGNLPFNLTERKQVSISGTRFLNLRVRRKRSLPYARPSKWSNIDEY